MSGDSVSLSISIFASLLISPFLSLSFPPSPGPSKHQTAVIVPVASHQNDPCAQASHNHSHISLSFSLFPSVSSWKMGRCGPEWPALFFRPTRSQQSESIDYVWKVAYYCAVTVIRWCDFYYSRGPLHGMLVCWAMTFMGTTSRWPSTRTGHLQVVIHACMHACTHTCIHAISSSGPKIANLSSKPKYFEILH